MISEINTSLYEKLDSTFYLRPNVVQIAKDLLGKILCTEIDGVLTAGKIVETEAYSGRGDKACHANGKRTPRTEVMYGEGGHAYIYLCYGIHHLFNVVTNAEGMADAVLVRALEPLVGIEEMRIRRDNARKLTSGPGTLSEALGMKKDMTGTCLRGNRIWIANYEMDDFQIETDVRIGVDYAGEDALKPWRFLIRENDFVSKHKKSPGGLSPGSTNSFT